MKDVFAKLAADFFSTIVFVAVYVITDNVVLATGAEVSSISKAKEPKGARIRKIVMANLIEAHLYVVKIQLETKGGKVKQIFTVSK